MDIDNLTMPSSELTAGKILDAVSDPMWLYCFRARRLVWANQAGLHFWGRPTVAKLNSDPPPVPDHIDAANFERLRHALHPDRAITEDLVLCPDNADRAMRCRIWPCRAQGSPDGMLVQAQPLEGLPSHRRVALERIVPSDETEPARRVDNHRSGHPSRLEVLFPDRPASPTIEQRRDQFHQAQKHEAAGRLVGAIAHDFNNILAGILGYASFLVEDLPPSSRAHAYACQIRTAGDRGRDLVGQVLTFSQHRPAGRAPVDVAAVVSETAALFKATLRSGLILEADDLAEETAVHGNATEISQAVMNLCVNARDAMTERNGIVAVSVRRVCPDERLVRQLRGTGVAGTGPDPDDGVDRLRVGVLAPAQLYVSISVADAGTGIAPEVMANMFEPFFTTKPAGAGSGLGLAAVHGIVLGHGGGIAVESRLGGGTVFRLVLPASAEGVRLKDATPSAGAAVTPVQDLPPGTILIVDEASPVGDMLAERLDRLGYHATTVASADSALDAFLEDTTAWSTVILDQAVPNAGRIAARMHGVRPDMPIILTSGQDVWPDPDQLSRNGIGAFLRKPFTLAELFAALTCAGGAPRD